MKWQRGSEGCGRHGDVHGISGGCLTTIPMAALTRPAVYGTRVFVRGLLMFRRGSSRGVFYRYVFYVFLCLHAFIVLCIYLHRIGKYKHHMFTHSHTLTHSYTQINIFPRICACICGHAFTHNQTMQSCRKAVPLCLVHCLEIPFSLQYSIHQQALMRWSLDYGPNGTTSLPQCLVLMV